MYGVLCFLSLTTGIPLTTLLTFNRLKVKIIEIFLGVLMLILLVQTLSSDAELIASALRKATADIVQVNSVCVCFSMLQCCNILWVFVFRCCSIHLDCVCVCVCVGE